MDKENKIVDSTKERERADDHQRTVMAQQDLKALKKTEASLGKPFHKIPLPAAMVHAPKASIFSDAKAKADLKILEGSRDSQVGASVCLCVHVYMCACMAAFVCVRSVRSPL